MSTSDDQHSHYSTNVPRRLRMVSSASPTPSTSLDDSVSSLDNEVKSFAASTPFSSSAPAFAPPTPTVPLTPISPTPSSTLGSQMTPSPPVPPVPPIPSSLPAHSPQIMRPPSLKLPSILPTPPKTVLPPGPSSMSADEAEYADTLPYEHAIDFATQSWDLATGGLKTMTAKRELPTRLDRKSLDLSMNESLDRTTRNYTFALIIMMCIILMLIGSGVVIFVLLQ